MSELISGKEALIALANGEGVEFKNPFQNIWVDIRSLTINEINGGYYRCSDDNEKIDTVFRLKPKTITLNGIDAPAPFEPKEDCVVFILDDSKTGGYRRYSYEVDGDNDSCFIGLWRTEDEIKQVVTALRSVFKGK